MKNKNQEHQYSNDFKIVSQMKSWMAINPSWGCVWDCVYCIQHKDAFFDTPTYKKVQKAEVSGKPITPKEVVNYISSDPRITPKTPIIIYNFSDPFLQQNVTDLREILGILDRKKLTNIVGMITRTPTDAETLDCIADLESLRPIVIVSYSGYTNPLIEKGSLEGRVKLLRELQDRKIHTVHYLRPMVKEWMEKNQLKTTREAIGDLVGGVVMSGIRLTPEVVRKIKMRGLPVPQVSNFVNKFFPKDLQEEILEVYKEGPPVFRYTSCAVSSIFGIPDYNSHLGFFRHTQNKAFATSCPLPCKDGQKEVCKNGIAPEKTKVRALLNGIGHEDVNFEIRHSGAIILDRKLSKYDLSFLRHNTSCHVDYDGNLHHIDQVANMGVKSTK